MAEEKNPTPSRDQYVIHALIAQRDAALNDAAGLSADLQMVRAKYANALTEIVALRAEVQEKSGGPDIKEDQNAKQSGRVQSMQQRAAE